MDKQELKGLLKELLKENLSLEITDEVTTGLESVTVIVSFDGEEICKDKYDISRWLR